MNDKSSKGKHESANAAGVLLAISLAFDGGVASGAVRCGWAAEEGVEDNACIGECRGRNGPQRGYGARVRSI